VPRIRSARMITSLLILYFSSSTTPRVQIVSHLIAALFWCLVVVRTVPQQSRLLLQPQLLTISSTATSTHTTSSSTVSASPAPPAHGLSQTGKVGVGIGIPFAVLCLGLLALTAFQVKRKKNGNVGGSGITEYRSELENTQAQRNTMLSYGSGQTEPVLPYGSHGQGPMQELPEK